MHCSSVLLLGVGRHVTSETTYGDACVKIAEPSSSASTGDQAVYVWGGVGGLPLNFINLRVSAVIYHAGLHNRKSH